VSYSKQRSDWKDWPNTSTKIRAQDLDGIEQGISDAHDLAKASLRRVGKMQSQGWYEETFNRQTGFSTSQPTSGDVIAGLVFLLEGDVVTNIVYELGVNAASVTTCKFGLYDVSGNLLASTANDTAAVTGSNGPRSKALSNAYTVTSSGPYYVANITVATTMPNFGRGSSSTASQSALSGFIRSAWTQTGQSDLPNPATFATLNIGYWFAVS